MTVQRNIQLVSDREKSLTGKEPLRIWLRLLGLNNLISQYTRNKFRKEFNITLPQFDVLAELGRTHKPMTMTELSRELMVSNGNITGVIDRLERDGLVQRSSSLEDRRVQHLSLTATGGKAFKNMAQGHESWVAELFSGVTQSEIKKCSEQLRNIKITIVENIRKSEEK